MVTKVMGILNVTPDSFSDGGENLAPENAVSHALEMERDGAGIIDVGGESTRPGSSPVSLEEELGRVLPVIRALRSRLTIPISIDTSKAIVALRACEEGATMINDISAGSDPEMFDVAKHTGSELILMHMKGTPQTMQERPTYVDVVREVQDFLKQRAGVAIEQGIGRDRIWLDPGIGFGKSVEDNYKLLRSLPSFTSLPFRVVVGASRKSFIRRRDEPASYAIITDDAQRPMPHHRLGGSIAVAILAAECGVAMVRVHDVQPTVHAIEVAAQLKGLPS